MPVTILLQPQLSGSDTWIDSGSPTTSHGSDVTLTLSTSTRILLRFPFRKVPHNFVLTDARLGLWMKTGSVGVSLYRVTRFWSSAATWNLADTGVPWTAPGGDYDAATLLASGTMASNAMAYIGAGSAALKTAINNFLNEYTANFGLILVVTSGSGTAYAMDDVGASYTEQSPSTPAVDRTTFYHPVLELTGNLDYTKPSSLLVSPVYMMEKRVSKFVLNRPTIALPVTLAQGVPFLDQAADVTGLVEDWSFSRARTTGAAEIQVQVYDEIDELNAAKSGKYKDFWQPMDVLSLEERLFVPGDQYRYVVQATAVIDGDQEEVERDIPGVPLECRDAGLYGLINTVEIKLLAGQIKYPALITDPPLELEKDPATGPTTTGYYVFRHRLSTGEQTYNWVADPKPHIFTINRGTVLDFANAEIKTWTESDQLRILYGPGEVWIEETFFNTEFDEEGMGNPEKVYISYKRYKNPLDDYLDSMPVNVALYKVLQKAGYQHVEPPGYLYIKSLPPVLADFVFDKVITTGTGGADVSTLAQAETGATLQPSFTFCQNVGDAVYFALTDVNHRFNWVYWVPYRLAVGGTFVWEYWNGTAWTAIPPLTTPASWLRGATDPGAANFTAGGLITFDEAQLTTWATTPAPTIPGFTDTLKRFWMRVRCTAAPTTAPIAHRFAGKEVLQLGQDRKSNTFRDFDEKKHLEVCEEILQQWGVPNYTLLIDRYGDVEGKYIVQKALADYTLTPLDKVKRQRDSKRIYTRVVVKVAEFDNEALLDYAAKINGGQPFHDPYSFQDKSGNVYTTDDYLTSKPPGLTRAQKLFLPIDGSEFTLFGVDYKAANRDRWVYDYELENKPIFRVAFTQGGSPVSIKLAGLECRANDIHATFEGFYPTDPETDPTPDSLTAPTNGVWQVLPGASQIKISARKAMKRIDFTKDADPDRPVVSQVRIIPWSFYRHEGHLSPRLYAWIVYLRCLGTLTGSILLGEAVIGSTPPFTTPADQAFINRYGVRTFAVEKNAFIQTTVEALRYAKDQLRELARLFDPLDVVGIHPLVEIGDTVRVQESILGLNHNYVVEEIDRKVGMNYSARLVPYRFGDTTDPPLPAVYPQLTMTMTEACLPSTSVGGGTDTTDLFEWYRGTEGVVTSGDDVVTWTSQIGSNFLENVAFPFPNATLITGALGGFPAVRFSGSNYGFGGAAIGLPVHVFLLMRVAVWSNSVPILRFGNTMVLLLGDTTAKIVSANSSEGFSILSINSLTNSFILVEAIYNGADSALAVREEMLILGDLGTQNPAPLEIGPTGAATIDIAELRIYSAMKNSFQATAIRDDMKTYWGLT